MTLNPTNNARFYTLISYQSYTLQTLLLSPLSPFFVGPAMIAFTDGKYIGANLDRNGLRPSRYYVTKDDHVILSSEIGVLPDLPEKDVKIKARLEPGKMFLVDFDKGEIVSDSVIKEEISSAHNYSQWLESHSFSLDDWMDSDAARKVKINCFCFFFFVPTSSF